MNLFSLKWNDFIPHYPSGKQTAFLMLPQLEAFFGGAAGGGKSDALLMAALQYVDVPGYHAIIFRKTLADLEKADALIARSHEWASIGEWKEQGAKWNGSTHIWTFPTGATLEFGHMGSGYMNPSGATKFKYQGSAYQTICFDELTQHDESDYLFMFSRLRKKRCPIHAIANPACASCKEFGPISKVPLRVRAASNPGGVGHEWVKNRFSIKLISGMQDNKLESFLDKYYKGAKTPAVLYRGTNPKRPHIPSFVSDNPFLDENYLNSLSELDSVTREQMLRGDWNVSEQARFSPKWVKLYSRMGDYLYLGSNQTGKQWHLHNCRKFQTIDPAASTKEGPGDAAIWRRQPSWTVISTWLITPDNQLVWWDMVRFQVEIPDIFPKLRENYIKHLPDYIGIESNGSNLGVYQGAMSLGLPVQSLSPRAMDKLVRSTDAQVRMEQGKVWFPQDEARNPWIIDVKEELFTWTGHPRQIADIIDTFSYASLEMSKQGAYSNSNFTMTIESF